MSIYHTLSTIHLTATFHLTGRAQLSVILKGRMFQPKGICQLFSYQYQRKYEPLHTCCMLFDASFTRNVLVKCTVLAGLLQHVG